MAPSLASQRNVTREYCPSSVDGLAEKLYCSGGIPILDMRLAAGTSSTSGRLEVLVGEDWGTVREGCVCRGWLGVNYWAAR